MKRNIIKFSVAAVVLSFVFGAAVRTKAYPPYVRQAAKFGAKLERARAGADGREGPAQGRFD